MSRTDTATTTTTAPGTASAAVASTGDALGPYAARALAPSLDTLLRFASATEELARLRGRFAFRAGRFGPEAVAEASRRLFAAFEEGAGPVGAAPPAPDAGPGLALDWPARLLDEEFGQGRVVRFEGVDFPAALAHAPTRRFLRETGLPEDGFLFHLDTDLPLPSLAEYHEAERPGVRLPARAGRLIRLGHLVGDSSLVVDGESGEVLGWCESEAVLRPLNRDVSTLALTLWLLHRERAIDENLSHGLTTDAYDRLAATMLRVLRTAAPLPPAARPFRDGSGGALRPPGDGRPENSADREAVAGFEPA